VFESSYNLFLENKESGAKEYELSILSYFNCNLL
jgi:hypothetical protein